MIFIAFFSGCCVNKKLNNPQKGETTGISSLKFIDEYVIPTQAYFDSTIVGGLSGIDYANGKYYTISDDKKRPVRFYELDLKYSQKGFSSVDITGMTVIKTEEKYIDPESIRYDKYKNRFFWTSEGAVRKGVSPAVFEIDRTGMPIRKYNTPDIFKVKLDKTKGPRQNGTFECLSMSVDTGFYWVGMELPLKEDGEEPKLLETNSPVRISKINKNTGEVDYQFAYYLNPIPKDSKPKGKFRVNGLPEILSIDDNTFLFIERAYASGYKDGGNTVRIYKVDANGATDIKWIPSLKKAKFIAAKKTLLFDFETIRSKLTKGIVDNIEGICFGKTLNNGHKTLVLVSDNNFSMFSPQLNQIIVLEIMP